MRFGTWNVRSLYRAGSLSASARELTRYKLDLVGAEGSVPLAQYCSGDKIEKNEMGGECSTYGERRGVCRVRVGKSEGKRPLGRSRLGLEDNIKMDLQEVGCGVMDWIELAQDRGRRWALANALMNLRVHYFNVSNCVTQRAFCTY
jgi:hypothetical protein